VGFVLLHLGLEVIGVEQLGQLCGLVEGGEKMWEVVDVMGLLMTLWYGRERWKPVN
jgi:hypothetical protein